MRLPAPQIRHQERHTMQKAVRKKELKVVQRPTSLRGTLEWLKPKAT